MAPPNYTVVTNRIWVFRYKTPIDRWAAGDAKFRGVVSVRRDESREP